MPERERFETRIEKIVAGGDGLGRHEGQVVFVPGSAPGERLLVELVERQRDYLRARILRVLEPSTDRREPPCAFYGDCGGCSIMHLRPEPQAEAKRQILRESLRRSGGLNFSGEIPIRTGPESGYRTRSRFHVRRWRQGVIVGFNQRGSHRLVDVTRCLQISPAANEVLGELRRWLASKPAGAGTLASIEIVEPSLQSGRPLVQFLVHEGRALFPAEIEGLLHEADLAGLAVTETAKAPTDRRNLRLGRTKIVSPVGGFLYQVGLESFFQSNRFLLERLVGEVVSGAGPNLGKVVDLYCGVGLFTLPLAAVAERVTGVDSSSQAIRDARVNARRAGLSQVSFLCQPASHYVERQDFKQADWVVVDPPRGGLEPPVVDALSKHPPLELRYVSCDPASFGRDAGKLDRGGLELRSLVLLDMFPNTHHFEIVASFRKRTP